MKTSGIFKASVQLSQWIDLIESKSSWQTVFFFPPLSFPHAFSCEPNNNKTYFISRVLTRRVAPRLLFISIRHRTSITLRSGTDRGVNKCAYACEYPTFVSRDLLFVCVFLSTLLLQYSLFPPPKHQCCGSLKEM